MKKTISKFILLIFCTFAFAQSYSIRDKNSVNEFDRIWMNKYNKPLDYLATGLEITSLAFPLVCFTAPGEDHLKIGIQYAETMAIAFGFRCLFKATVERTRPYMYFEGAPEKDVKDGDWNKSFMSGHSIMSFAAAGFTTYTFLHYCPNSKWTIPVIAGAYTIALSTSALRVASGNHFMTDVIAGALTGTVIGYVVPMINALWFEPTLKNTPISISANSVKLSFKW